MNAVSSKETLPIGTWMMPVRSTRNSTRPLLDLVDGSCQIRGDSTGLGVGHQSAGTKYASQPANSPIMSGVATATSKSIHPPEFV